MQALRLNEVLTRVVAWHNRHPLAQRIQAVQVHSIGEVVLPFASAVALHDSAAPPPLTAPKGWREAAPPASLATNAQPASPGEAAAAASAARRPAAETRDAEIDDALDLALDLDMTPDAAAPDAETVTATVTATDADAAAALQDPFELAEADMAAAELAAQDHADLALPLASPTADAPGPPALSAAPAAAAPAQVALAKPPPGWLARGWARLAGRPAGWPPSPPLPRLQAAFSRNFIWPLSPGRVARWARAHGQTGPVAPPDWPRRLVQADEPLCAAARQKGLHHAAQLHLLTAAIGVGDRRIRVLIGADGAILGPRAYSRPRMACAVGLLTVVLLASGWALLLPVPGAKAGALAAAATPATTLAEAPANTAAATPATAPASAPGDTASSPGAVPVAPADVATPPAALALATNTASAPIARIKPVLSDEDRLAARQQATALRGAPVPNPPPTAAAPAGARTDQTTQAAHTAPVYAVVTRARRQHQSAVKDLALLRSAGKRLSGPLPEHGELMQNQGEWRAAWWPFASLADAERARVLLAGLGLKAEVVAF